MRRTVIALLVAIVAARSPQLAGQWQWTSVWEGVYTPEQAARGREAYEASCSRCHLEDLTGASGRPLVGSRFWQDWGEDTLQSLSNVTRATMPQGAAGSLSDSAYFDIVAYILERNGYPAGREDLTAGRVERIRVVGKEGRGPVPNFALVTVVGCLQHPKGVWTLGRGSEPARTRNPESSSGSDREAVDAMPLGPHTFELMDVHSLGDGRENHKVEVRGLLIRGLPDRVNVTALRTIAAVCAP